jgi:hypothetical protein
LFRKARNILKDGLEYDQAEVLSRGRICQVLVHLNELSFNSLKGDDHPSDAQLDPFRSRKDREQLLVRAVSVNGFPP